MKYKRRNIIGEEEEMEGDICEIMFFLQYLDNKEKYYVFLEGEDYIYYDDKIQKERGYEDNE